MQTIHSILYGEPGIVPVPFDGLEPRYDTDPLTWPPANMTLVLIDEEGLTRDA